MKNIQLLRSLVVLFLSMTLMSCSGEETNQIESAQPTIALKGYTHSAFEIELLDLVNQDRVSKGLNALTIINEISYVGSTHADYMIINGVASHDNFDQRVISLKNGLIKTLLRSNRFFAANTSSNFLLACLNLLSANVV